VKAGKQKREAEERLRANVPAPHSKEKLNDWGFINNLLYAWKDENTRSKKIKQGATHDLIVKETRSSIFKTEVRTKNQGNNRSAGRNRKITRNADRKSPSGKRVAAKRVVCGFAREREKAEERGMDRPRLVRGNRNV